MTNNRVSLRQSFTIVQDKIVANPVTSCYHKSRCYILQLTLLLYFILHCYFISHHYFFIVYGYFFPLHPSSSFYIGISNRCYSILHCYDLQSCSYQSVLPFFGIPYRFQVLPLKSTVVDFELIHFRINCVFIFTETYTMFRF